MADMSWVLAAPSAPEAFCVIRVARTLVVGSFVVADASADCCDAEFECFGRDGFVGRVSGSAFGASGGAVVSGGGVVSVGVVSDSPVAVPVGADAPLLPVVGDSPLGEVAVVFFFDVGLEFEGAGEFSDDESEEEDDDDESPLSASAVPHPYPVMTAVPIPNATASPPIRPTYDAALMLDGPSVARRSR
jgi:hypothetical protein